VEKNIALADLHFCFENRVAVLHISSQSSIQGFETPEKASKQQEKLMRHEQQANSSCKSC
jgi:hypothetical protein